jgi:hypothetical protein
VERDLACQRNRRLDRPAGERRDDAHDESQAGRRTLLWLSDPDQVDRNLLVL